MDILKQTKKGLKWSFLQQISVQIINFFVQILLARLLLPSDFGLIAMITIFIAIGQTLSDSGMASSLIRKEENTELDYGTVFITNLVISIVIYFFVFLLAPYVAGFYEQEVLSNILRVYSLVFVINSFISIQLTKFTKEMNFKIQFYYQLPSVVIGAGVGVFLAFNNYGVWSLVWLNIAQSICFATLMWFFHSWRPKFVFEKVLFKYHFDFGYKLTISGLINTIYLNLYKILIGKNFSTMSVGFFTQADNLRLFPINQLSSILNKVTFPLFAKLQNDNAKLLIVYKSLLRMVLALSSVMMLALILIADPLFEVLFGSKWSGAVPYFKILCIASVFLPLGLYNLNILKVKGRSDLFLKIELVKKFIGIVTLFACLPFGINAIVWGLCITNICFAYLNGYYSGKFLNYSLFSQVRDSFYIVLIAIIPFIIAVFLNNYYKVDNSFLRMAADICVFLGIYMLLVFLFNKSLINDFKKFIVR